MPQAMTQMTEPDRKDTPITCSLHQLAQLCKTRQYLGMRTIYVGNYTKYKNDIIGQNSRELCGIGTISNLA